MESVLNNCSGLIISDNLGHLSSSKFLECEFISPLGERDVSQQMATVIENFSFLRKTITGSELARKKYVLDFAIFLFLKKMPISNFPLSMLDFWG